MSVTLSYQALARKWRPRRFDELVGQAPVRRALINALDSGRIHPAYLFTGTRGVGKTTLARLLAKCLNCEQGVSSTPCGECRSCREIDEGRFIDLIEVDAASRTKVEDTRELLENVQYAPVHGRYKVYLIDEVHMLSGHSFNALLKTLEEPPAHVQFLLATTDPQKLPATILSRCVQFALRRISDEDIAQHLSRVLQNEGMKGEPGGIRLLASAADGSLRDALSLLDQAIAFGGGQVTESEVREMLGTVPREAVFPLLHALAKRDGARLMAAVKPLDEMAADYFLVLAELLTVLHRVALLQLVPSALQEESSELHALAAEFSPQDVQLFYQIILIGRRDLPFAADPRSGFEMILLRMLAFQPAGDEVIDPGHPPKGRDVLPKSSSQPAFSLSLKDEQNRGSKGHKGEAPPTPSFPSEETGQTNDAIADTLDWAGRLSLLKLRGLTAELASHCVLESIDGGRYRLSLARKFEGLLTETSKKRLTEALAKLDGQSVRLEFRVVEENEDTPAAQREREAARNRMEAEKAIENDVLVGALKERFNGKIIPGSIEAVSDEERSKQR